MIHLKLLHNSNNFSFLKSIIGYVERTCKKTYPMVNLKKKLLELYRSCKRIISHYDLLFASLLRFNNANRHKVIKVLHVNLSSLV
jgi:hypothetical protein